MGCSRRNQFALAICCILQSRMVHFIVFMAVGCLLFVFLSRSISPVFINTKSFVERHQPSIRQESVRITHQERKFHDGASEDTAITHKQGGRSHPRQKYFINCGGTFPQSLKLFITTYPHPEKFKLVTFLKHGTFAMFYDEFQNHTLYNTVSVGTRNASISYRKQKFGFADDSAKIFEINIAEWIKKRTHVDDYVILKLDTDQTINITKHLIATDAIEFIDKLYITENDSGIFSDVKQVLGDMRIPVNVWDDKSKTYSDIDKVNVPRVPRPGVVLHRCETKIEKRFAVMLYGTTMNNNFIKSIELLRRSLDGRRVNSGLYLPSDFINNHQDVVSTICYQLQCGLNLDTSVMSEIGFSKKIDTERIYATLRNQVIAAENVFAKNGYILHYVKVPTMDSLKNVTERLAIERHVNIFDRAKDVSFLTTVMMDGGIIDAKKLNLSLGEYLSVDLSAHDGGYLALYILRRFEPFLLSTLDCNFKSSHT